MNVTGALCASVDPSIWFPDTGGTVKRAIKVCADCPLIAECLDYALHNEDGLYGVWGGTSATERAQIRATRSITLPTKGEMTRDKVTARLAWGWTAQMIADDLDLAVEYVTYVTRDLATRRTA